MTSKQKSPSPECFRAMVTAVKNDLQLKEFRGIRDRAVIDIENRLCKIKVEIREKYGETK